MFVVNETFLSCGQGFLYTDRERTYTRSSICFLSSEKLDDEKWRIHFSVDRIHIIKNAGENMNGYSSSVPFSFVVQKGTELRFSDEYIKYASEEIDIEAAFGKKKTASREFKGKVDHVTVNEISQDSINVDFYLLEKECIR